MDYKKEIENFLNEIQSEKFLKFLYNVIVSFKKDATEKVVSLVSQGVKYVQKCSLIIKYC